MTWRFDPYKVELIFAPKIEIVEGIGDIDMGEYGDADLSIDLGSREDSPSQIDQGLRVYNGDL